MEFCIRRDLSLCLQWQDASTAYFQYVQFFKHSSSSLKLISVGLKKGQKYSGVHLSVKQKLELIEMLDPGLSR
jgi:hypothetical protein